MGLGLHIAVEKRQEETVLALLKDRSNTEAKDPAHFTPLHYACLNGSFGIARMLIRYNANLFARTKAGDIPATLAKEKGHLDIYRLICKKDAAVSDYIRFIKNFNHRLNEHVRHGLFYI
jgi:ankyrin repeat protein